MNHITVIAHGSEGSFARRVQEDPGIAIEMLHLCRMLVRFVESVRPGGGVLAGEAEMFALARRTLARAEGHVQQHQTELRLWSPFVVQDYVAIPGDVIQYVATDPSTGVGACGRTDRLHAELDAIALNEAFRMGRRAVASRCQSRVVGEGDYGGVEGADGAIHSDADPGL